MTKEQIEQVAIDAATRYIFRDDLKDIRGSYKVGFEEGVNWRINSVWHPYTIEPDKGRLLLVEDIDSAYDLVYLTKGKPWEEISKRCHYMRWAYVEDLLPTRRNDYETSKNKN